MNSQYLIYRAKVVALTPPSEDGSSGRTIYISPIDSMNLVGAKKTATPPNPLPTTMFGNGLLTVPNIGQECLVGESRTDRVIISYLNTRGANPYGIAFTDTLDIGDIKLSAGSINSIELFLGNNGVGSISAGELAHIKIDSYEKFFTLKGRTGSIVTSSGHHKYFYNRDTNEAGSIHVYNDKNETKSFTDSVYRLEQSIGVALLGIDAVSSTDYANKAMVKTGKNSNTGAPYAIETLQSIDPLNVQDKNVVSSLYIGYQNEHKRYNQDVLLPKGTLLEFRAKKNITNNIETALFRIGGNGEDLYNFHLSTGLNNNIPFGKPILDPLGEGRGYNIKQNSQLGFNFSEVVSHKPEKYYSFMLNNVKLSQNDSFSYSREHNTTYLQRIYAFNDDGSFTQDITASLYHTELIHGESVNTITLKPDLYRVELYSGTNIELSQKYAKFGTKDDTHLELTEGGKIKLGNSSNDLLKLIDDVLDALIKTKSPGYGAPLPTVADFVSIKSKLKTLI